MAATQQPNNRASLLSGLRTGGVRSVSVPQTAGPANTFNIPRIARSFVSSTQHGYNHQDQIDALSDSFSRGFGVQDQLSYQQPPRTASYHFTDAGRGQREMLSHPYGGSQFVGEQEMLYQQQQLQLMQLEFMKLRSLTHVQQQLSNAQASVGQNTVPMYYNNIGSGPFSAAPMAQSFNAFVHDSNNGAMHRGAEAYGNVMGFDNAGAGANRRGYSKQSPPLGARRDSLVSGNNQSAMAPSKSDSAVSWRRGSTAAAEGNEQKVIPQFKLTSHCTTQGTDGKIRPEPLTLSKASEFVAAAVSSGEEESESSSRSDTDQGSSSSSPITPTSNASSATSVSAREEASKKLFKGLGVGRPSILVSGPEETHIGMSFSQPTRQPKGPPAAADELGEKNFANRIRRRAIGGLGALLQARERREGGADGGIN